MKEEILLLVCLIACLELNLIACNNCCQISSRQLPYYKFVKSKARSDQLILATTTVRNVNQCRKFASMKKALAFNYGLDSDFYGWNSGIQNRTKIRKICQALECSEIYNFTTLVRDKNYKYYSIYPSSIPTGPNFTLACIPRTGIFVFSNYKVNYSQAQTACQKMNASLAHVISEERTNGLAKYLSLNTFTFIGLSKYNNEKFWKNDFGESIMCFNYRAWGKGEPSHSKGCVGLVQPPKSEPGPFWKVVPCGSILPFICEISPLYRYLHNERF